MANVDIEPLEAALLRSLIHTAAATGVLVGVDGEVYAIEHKGFDILVNVSTKLQEIPLSA